MINAYTYDMPIGRMLIAENGRGIVAIDLYREGSALPADWEHRETDLLRQAKAQLDAYFAGSGNSFDLPLDPQGTAFQKRVWAELCRIPYGQTRSYREIAEAAGCPRGFRAVGMANNRNPIMIVIPCHRVIGSDGSLVGYEGGLAMKERLLRLEGAL